MSDCCFTTDDAVPLLITVAPNGARKGKADHPAIPMSPAELAREAAACREAGAAMLHLHVRDADGGHSLDAEHYREALRAVRAAVGEEMILQITTEAVGRYQPEEQMACVRAVEPEAVSLAVRELLPEGGDERVFAEFVAWMHRRGILPQYILYSREDLARFLALQQRGLIPDCPQFLLFVLGRYSSDQQSRPEELREFLLGGSMACNWAVCAFGRLEYACALTAAGLCGHARLGFENNTLMKNGEVAPDNAALIRQYAAVLPDMGRRTMTAGEARQWLAGLAAV